MYQVFTFICMYSGLVLQPTYKTAICQFLNGRNDVAIYTGEQQNQSKDASIRSIQTDYYLGYFTTMPEVFFAFVYVWTYLMLIWKHANW